MDNNTKKKYEQLGMPQGTASGKLRKIIMFDLLKQLEKDICYRCSEKIKSVDELSIEHKEPWLDSANPVGKFFDLNNISFSHLKCNIGDARQPRKIIAPEGQAWCRKCKQFKLIDAFPESKKYNRHEECRGCHTKRTSERRERTGKR